MPSAQSASGDRDITVLLAFALMDAKSAASYKSVFSMLKQKAPKWAPRAYSCDYEGPMRSSFESVFVGAEFQGCIFHLIQAHKRKMQSLGITDRVQTRILSMVRDAAGAPTQVNEHRMHLV